MPIESFDDVLKVAAAREEGERTKTRRTIGRDKAEAIAVQLEEARALLTYECSCPVGSGLNCPVCLAWAKIGAATEAFKAACF